VLSAPARPAVPDASLSCRCFGSTRRSPACAGQGMQQSVAAKPVQLRSLWVIPCLDLPSRQRDHLYPGLLASRTDMGDPAGCPCWTSVPPSLGQCGLGVTETGERGSVQALTAESTWLSSLGTVCFVVDFFSFLFFCCCCCF